jgi:CBS domain-containing protein
MRVSDAMTKEVVSVEPATPIKRVAALMVDHRISGMPVVDDGRVVGVVSATDIVPGQAGPQRRRRLFGSDSASKAGARTAGEAMSGPAITVSPWSSLAAAALVMTRHDVNRLPVVRDETLVGVITRGDVVRAYARSDRDIADEIRSDVLSSFELQPDEVSVEVADGEVTLRGAVLRSSDIPYVTRTIERLTGVVSVRSELTARQAEPTRWD